MMLFHLFTAYVQVLHCPKTKRTKKRNWTATLTEKQMKMLKCSPIQILQQMLRCRKIIYLVAKFHCDNPRLHYRFPLYRTHQALLRGNDLEQPNGILPPTFPPFSHHFLQIPHIIHPVRHRPTFPQLRHPPHHQSKPNHCHWQSLPRKRYHYQNLLETGSHPHHTNCQVWPHNQHGIYRRNLLHHHRHRLTDSQCL